LPSKPYFGAQTGCGDVTSLYKNLVKNRKTNFRRQAIQEPIFPVAIIIQILKAVTMIMVTAIEIMVIYAQPSHVVFFIKQQPHTAPGRVWSKLDIFMR
jgi:hypothetical protein